MRESTELLDRPEALRARLDADGYLLLRGLLPAEDVLGVRSAVLDVVNDQGWLAAGHDSADGIADVAAYDATPEEVTSFRGVVIGPDGYKALYRLEAFHRLAHHPALVSLYERLLGAPVLVHPRTIARVMIPSARTHPTPPHQDFIHVQGSDRTMTAWIPLGDCPGELGGLAVLAGSHREGLLSYRPADGAGDIEAYLCNLPYGWVTTDYRAGDVLTFTSQTVHRSLPNRTGERIRLSVDYRYQPAGEPVDQGTLEPHVGVATWDEVYADWPEDSDLRYFWRDDAPRVVPFDRSLRWQQDRIC